VNIGRYGLKLRLTRVEMSVSSIRMPRRNPNEKSAIAQTANDAAAEKAGSAEHGDGATARCGHASNLPIHVGVSFTAGGRGIDSGDEATARSCSP
jgi:hypothetical protein